MLLCPAWLLRSSRLEVRGHVTACGRDALHVVATRRAGLGDWVSVIRLRSGRTEALVDAELGILLRDVASGAGDVRVDLPSGLRTEPEPDRLSSVRDADPWDPGVPRSRWPVSWPVRSAREQ
jgi:hypothetical protein